MTEITGSCLCGNSSFKASEHASLSGHCHCVNCRKTSLTGHASFLAVPRAAFSHEGETTSFDYKADSGNTVTRHFCPTCGSPLFNENTGMPDMVMVPGSVFDDPEAFTPQMTVYASRAVSWDKPADGLPAFPEMPPME